MTTQDFEQKHRQARESIINSLVQSGAQLIEIDDPEIEDQLVDELTILLLDNVEYYVGPATCDTSLLEHWEIDQDAKFLVLDPNSHHHFEVAALPVASSPLSLEELAEMVYPLKPETPDDQLANPDFCEPFTLEVSDDDESNNVWVVRRFRVDDVSQPDFSTSMREVVDLVGKVQGRVLS